MAGVQELPVLLLLLIMTNFKAYLDKDIFALAVVVCVFVGNRFLSMLNL